KMISAGATDFVQPSVVKIGGLTNLWQVATEAEKAGVTCVPHAFFFGPVYLATLHAIAAKERVAPLERLFGDVGFTAYAKSVPVVDGAIDVPDRPGLGADPEEAVIDRLRAVARRRPREEKMINMSRRDWIAGAMASTALLCARPAAAQAYPQRPVRIIVPYAPGGGTDVFSRLLAAQIEREFGQTLVIDNRGGGGSTIGTQAVANAQPDGYTIGMVDSAFV